MRTASPDTQSAPETTWGALRPAGLLAALLLLAAASVVWAYWTTLGDLVERWRRDPDYSHGFLVPLFSVALLVLRAPKLRRDRLAPSWWGVLVLLAGVLVRLAGALFYLEWFDALSLVPCLFGLCLLIGGRHAAQWACPAILFLLFMVPLPYRLDVALAQPLQQVATRASSYALVTLGLPAIAEGSVIILNDVEIGVVGACSGLRMLVVFFAIATGVALLIRRAWWERLVLVASAIPIAIAANVARIVVTGLLYQVVSNEAASRFFHDLAGWFMIPLALTMVWAELRVLSRLWVPDPAGDGGVVGLGLKPGEPADEAAAFAAARS